MVHRKQSAVIYLQVIEGRHANRHSARPGEFKPLHSSAIGKTRLGTLKEPELRALAEGIALTRGESHRVESSLAECTRLLVAPCSFIARQQVTRPVRVGA